MTVTEMRCPTHHRMFGKAMAEHAPVVVAGNLIEFSCKDCRIDGGHTAVLHRFDIAGELVETEVID